MPGFLALVLIGQYSAAIHAWLASQPPSGPTVGGFLYTTLASLALGLTLSTIRWLVLDRLHYRTGIRRPAWNFSRLEQHVTAFQLAVDYHYRYYQFYGNTLMVLVVSVFLPHPIPGLLPGPTNVCRLVLATLAMLFFVASRDALRNYHDRAIALQGKGPCRKNSPMTNGSGPHPQPIQERKKPRGTKATKSRKRRVKQAQQSTTSNA